MCNLEFPDLETMYQDYMDEGLNVIAVSGGGGQESESTLDAFVEQTGVTFPVVFDNGSYNSYDWPPSISPYPRQALVGRDGTLTYLASEHQPGTLETAILDALAE